MSNSWRFTQADWHFIMEDFRRKVHDTKNYDRIEYSKWKSLMAAINIDMDYDKTQKEFCIKCYDEDGDCFTAYLSGVDKTTKSGNQTFGDYLFTDVVQKSLGWRITLQPSTMQAFWGYVEKDWFIPTSALIGFDIYQPIAIEVVVDTSSREGNERCIQLRQDIPSYKVGYVWEGDNSFGDYLFKNIVDPQNPYIKKEETILATNYDTATAYTTTDYNGYTITCDPGSMAILNSSDLATGYATNSYNGVTNKTEIKENKEMDNKIFNFDFGPIKGDSVRMSMYGLAIKNRDGSYVAWDKINENIMNVDILNFSGEGLMYKMPVAIKDIKDGDIVIHNKVPMFVLEVFEKSLDVIDIYSGERKSIILSRSPFGFDFATKVISLIDFGAMGGDTPSADNPFGNMWPLLMLGDSGSIDPIMLALMCAGKGDCANPMMMYALMASKGSNDNLLPLMLMMNGGKFGC